MTDLTTLSIILLGLVTSSTAHQIPTFLDTLNITRRVDLDLPRLLYTMGIMPDIIPIGPIDLLNVTLYNGRELEIGSTYSHRELKEPPHVYWPYNLESPEYFTLSLANLDDIISNVDTRLEWHIWLVGNIPKNRVDLGDTLIEFQAPVETKDERFRIQHRVLILLWKQPESKLIRYKSPILTSSDHRWNYTVRNFIENYRLGIPSAATYFMMNE